MRLIEAFKGIQRYKFYSILVIILLGVGMTLCNMILQSQEDREEERVYYAPLWDGTKIYFSYDTLMEERPLEEEYLRENGSQFRVQRFIDELETYKEFAYFICGKHPIEAYIKNTPEEMLYDGNNVLKAHQVNENLINYYPISMSKGRSFSAEDYNYKIMERIPVILGNKYSELYDVGSQIKATFMSIPVTLEVIGIADKNTFFPLFDTLEYEDAYIIMPALRILAPPANEDEDFLQKAYALQNSSGFFRLSKDQNLSDLVNHLNSAKAQFGMYGVRLGRIDSGRLMALGLSSKEQREIYLGLAGVIFIYSYIILMVVLFASVRRNARRFCILFIAGGSKAYIASIVILEAIILTTSAFLFSMLLTYLIGSGEIRINYFSSFALLITGIVCAFPAIQQLFRSPILYLKKY